MKRDIGDLMDRWSIAKLKAERIGTDENKREYDAFHLELEARDGINELANMLLFINGRIWKHEAGLKGSKNDMPNPHYIYDEKNKETLIKMGIICDIIRDFNHIRVSLKNYINKINGEGFQDTKKDHLSENNNKTQQ